MIYNLQPDSFLQNISGTPLPLRKARLFKNWFQDSISTCDKISRFFQIVQSVGLVHTVPFSHENEINPAPVSLTRTQLKEKKTDSCESDIENGAT